MGQSRYHSEGASIWELPSHPRDARTLMLLNYLLATWGAVLHALLRRLIDLFGCQQHDGLCTNSPAGINRQRRGHHRGVIRGIDNDEGADVPKGEKEGFHFTADALEGLRCRVPPLRSARPWLAPSHRPPCKLL